MTAVTDRRAVLGTVLAAGTLAAALPAVAKPALGKDHLDYQRTLDLWNRWLEQNKLYDSLPVLTPQETLDKELRALNEIEDALLGETRASVHSLAVMLMIEMSHGSLEAIVADLHLASLAAIRSQLVGAIAEGADRVLAQAEEEGA